jgi:hypothetical protein
VAAEVPTSWHTQARGYRPWDSRTRWRIKALALAAAVSDVGWPRSSCRWVYNVGLAMGDLLQEVLGPVNEIPGPSGLPVRGRPPGPESALNEQLQDYLRR